MALAFVMACRETKMSRLVSWRQKRGQHIRRTRLFDPEYKSRWKQVVSAQTVQFSWKKNTHTRTTTKKTRARILGQHFTQISRGKYSIYTRNTYCIIRPLTMYKIRKYLTNCRIGLRRNERQSCGGAAAAAKIILCYAKCIYISLVFWKHIF